MSFFKSVLLLAGILLGGFMTTGAEVAKITASPSINSKAYSNAKNLIDEKRNTQYAVPKLKEFTATISYKKIEKARWLSIIQAGWKNSRLWAMSNIISVSINDGPEMSFRLAERPNELQSLDLGKEYAIKTIIIKVKSCYKRKDVYGGFAEITLSKEKPAKTLLPSQKIIAAELYPSLGNAPESRSEQMELCVSLQRKYSGQIMLELPCLDGSIWRGKLNIDGESVKKKFNVADFKCVKQAKYPLDFKFYAISSIQLIAKPEKPFEIKKIDVKWINNKNIIYPWEKAPNTVKIAGNNFWPGVFKNNCGNFGWRYEPNGLLINNVSFESLEHTYSIPKRNIAFFFKIPGGNYSSKKIVFRKDSDKRTGKMVNRSGLKTQKEYEVSPESYSNDKFKVDWTSFRWSKNISTDKGEKYRQELRYSILAPGIQVETDSPKFEIYAQTIKIKSGPKAILYQSGNTVKFISSPGKTTLSGMTKNWIIFMSGKSPEYPMMIVFQRKPDSVTISSDKLLFSNSKGVGTIAMGMPFGAVVKKRNTLSKWLKNTNLVPLKKFNKFVNLLSAYPWKCKEYFKLAGNKVNIVNKIDFLPWKDDWNSKPEKYAPLPPIIAYSINKNLLPQNTVKNTVNLGVTTKWGPYTAVPGNTIKYQLPVPDAFDYMPLQVAETDINSLLYKRLKKSIDTAVIQKKFAYVNKTKIKKPTLYPHYFAFDSSSGALRASNYMTPKARKELIRLSGKALDTAMLPQNYRLRIDPLSGATYMACTSWEMPKYKVNGDNIADIDYWQGLTIYGYYSQAKYGDKWDYVAKHWKSIRAMLSYWEASHSWALLSPGAREAGEMYHADMATAGYAGLVGFFKLAKRLGSEYEKELGAYLIAKAAVPMVAKFTFNDWMKKIGHRDDRSTALCSGFGERWVASMNECSNKYSKFEGRDPWWRTGCIGPLSGQDESMDLFVSQDFSGMLKWEKRFEQMCPNSSFIKQDTMRVMPHVMLRTYLSPQMYDNAEKLLKSYYSSYLLRDVHITAGFLAWKCPVRVQNWYPAKIISGVWNKDKNTADLIFDVASSGAEISALVKSDNIVVKIDGKKITHRILKCRGDWQLIAFRVKKGIRKCIISTKR